MLKEETWKVVKKEDLHWLKEVRLDKDIVSGDEALRRAENEGLDLVLVNSRPAVGRIMDYKKCLYNAQKREKENLKKQKENVQKVKEIKFHLSIGEADYLHKMKQIEEFINDKDRVDVKIVLRGREAYGNVEFINAFQKRVEESLSTIGTIIKLPKRDGKIIQMSVVKKEK